MPVDLDAIQARAAAASRGPWEWVGYPKPDVDLVASGIAGIDEPRERAGIRPVVLAIHQGICPRARDLAFIAHARIDVPALVAELRAARKVIDIYRRWHRPSDHPTFDNCESCRAFAAYDKLTRGANDASR